MTAATSINLWTHTETNEPRGYIDSGSLKELWFHTGTACNLACPFCLEGSKPGDNRLQRITLNDARPFIDEAVELGVEKFSFTGGEPFIVKDFVNILHYAANRRPCLVLTNGTQPVLKRLQQIAMLKNCSYPVSFRISIDYPNEMQHDAGRGAGSYREALQCIRELRAIGFDVSVARQMSADEDSALAETAYRQLLTNEHIDLDTRIVSFPDFGIPDSALKVPDVTENCMTTYQTATTRNQFMCSFSKMVVKKNGGMRVYACTLVDDDQRYDQGDTLNEASEKRAMLTHHRCYSCFKFGSSCSEG
ncbi:MAG: radical SAM protein [Gammaproteobacteria bacterium]|nr:radical SAM protein [Gammaproteobacteria bacterium]